MRVKCRAASHIDFHTGQRPRESEWRCRHFEIIRTSMPITLNSAHPTMRRAYRIFPLRKYGHPSFANNAGNMLQNAMMPLGVDGGTRSSAAERMMTYRTGHNCFSPYARHMRTLTIVD